MQVKGQFDYLATMCNKPHIFHWISQLGVTPALNRMEVARIVILNWLNLGGGKCCFIGWHKRPWTITFKDNGIGIAPEFQDKVFDMMFQRLHPPNQYSGTGIGLAMCKKVAECMFGANES